MNEAQIVAEIKRLTALWYARASIANRLAWLNMQIAAHNREHRP